MFEIFNKLLLSLNTLFILCYVIIGAIAGLHVRKLRRGIDYNFKTIVKTTMLSLALVIVALLILAWIISVKL